GSMEDLANSDNENMYSELSVSLSVDIGNTLLRENEDLKQELHDIKNSKSSRELELEDEVMQKEEEIKELITKYNVMEKQLSKAIASLNDKLQIEQSQKAELILLSEQEKEEYKKLFQTHCKHCTIVQEEMKNMLSSIKSLEEVNNVLQKDNVDLKTKLKSCESMKSNCLNCFPSLENNVQTKQVDVLVSNSVSNMGYTKVTYRRGGSIATKNKTVGSTVSSFASENPFAVLSLDADTFESTSITNIEKETTDGKIAPPKMLLCTDSHGKELAWYINKCTNKSKNSYDAVGFVRPGGRASQILDHKNIDGENMKDNDILVVICGTNDVSHNEAQLAINSITDILQRYSKQKIILVDIPNRYDLIDWSCVNVETKKTNAALKIICERFIDVTLVEASKSTRDLHTKHGLHFNRRGKLWLANRICEAAALTERENTSPSLPTDEQNINELSEIIPSPEQSTLAGPLSGNTLTTAQNLDT
ncbi:hypothetical protein J6590_099561, partial [Homalodisca vitripennis]